MTVRRVDDAVLLEDVCPVDDAEILMQELLLGAAWIDWSGCTHLHSACFQVILASGLEMRGAPRNPALANWLAPILHPDVMASLPPILSTPETPCLLEI